jgi:hypothetical protein
VIYGASLRRARSYESQSTATMKFNNSYKENLQWNRNATNAQAPGSVQLAEVPAKLRERDSGPLTRQNAIVPFAEASGYADFVEAPVHLGDELFNPDIALLGAAHSTDTGPMVDAGELDDLRRIRPAASVEIIGGPYHHRP